MGGRDTAVAREAASLVLPGTLMTVGGYTKTWSTTRVSHLRKGAT